MSALPPATLEGWYSLHQIFEIDYPAVRRLSESERAELGEAAAALAESLAVAEEGGWSATFRLAGGGADVMFVHFRESLDAIADVQARLRRSPIGAYLRTVYDYFAVTEAGLYHATAQAAKEFEAHSAEYRKALAEQVEAEAASPHVRTRLYPEPPAEMRYACFYPMSKRRTHPDNWYVLDVAERNRLMREHGMTGRRYGGRVFQVICGSVGLDDWEWGVTLFAADPLEFKRIVTEMRYDEASARFGEFGSFFTGVRVEPGDWRDLVAVR